MSFQLASLPYSMDALEPFTSRKTLEFHYGKHHSGYVTKLNAALEKKTEYRGQSLTQIIQHSQNDPMVANNACQIWNHDFFWQSLSPKSGNLNHEGLLNALSKDFGSFDEFKLKFMAAAGSLFGSGWVFLVKNSLTGQLTLTQESNAGCPLTQKNQVPLLTCDVWEHAYYLDYQNLRPNFVEGFWQHINWDFVVSNFVEGS
ncbi:MAG: superoxide dismutase [Proteobacteria bacterium]|nr:superoxide dismutase [Pseudomonadota bacterium]